MIHACEMISVSVDVSSSSESRSLYIPREHIFQELLPREEIIAQVDSTFDFRFGNTRLFFFFKEATDNACFFL